MRAEPVNAAAEEVGRCPAAPSERSWLDEVARSTAAVQNIQYTEYARPATSTTAVAVMRRLPRG